MSLDPIQHPWVFTLGILGNIVSFLVYIAPVPTFCRVSKRKSTEGFHAFPYVVSLFSAMLWIYYATVRSNILLITINSIGSVIETIYIAIFIAHAPKKARMLTLKLVALLNIGGFGLIVIFTHLFTKGTQKTQVLGWISVSLSASVFIAPLSIVRQVIRTKSVEFMPFWLSFTLVFSAVTWFFYGLLLKDLYIAVPNIVGFIFGILQIILYMVYKKSKESPKEQNAILIVMMKQPTTINNSEIHPVCSLSSAENLDEVRDQNLQDQVETGEREADESYEV